MANALFLLLGLVDLIGGFGIIFSGGLILPLLSKYIGVALLLKGIWTIITSFGD